MTAYGVVHDEEGPVAFVKDGRIYRDSGEGEVIGYMEDGNVLGLQRQYVGRLEPLGAGSGQSVVRRLLEPKG